MPGSGKHNVNNIDSFFRVRPSKNNIREGETVSFLEDGVLIKQEKRNGIVYEQKFTELASAVKSSQTTGDVTNLIVSGSSSSGADVTGITAGTGLSGGGSGGNITLNIDSTVTTLTGTQTLTNKTLTAPTLTTPALGTPASGVMTNVTGTAANLTVGNATKITSITNSNIVQLALSQTLTNKTLTAPTLTGTTQAASLSLSGDLTVGGTTTTLNAANLVVKDKNIVLNYLDGDSSATSDGAGITIQDAVNSSTDATILWDKDPGEFDFSHRITAPIFIGDVTGDLTGNADTATTLATNRAFSLTGDVTASGVNFNGSAAVELTTTIAADSVEGTMLNTNAADTSTLELSSDTLSVLKVPNALTAGTGITAAGTFDGAAARTISITPAQTAITSIYNTGLKLGYGSSDAHIDFSTDNEIHMEINGSPEFKVLANGISINQGDKIFLDGGGDTYIQDDSGDTMRFVVGNRNMIEMIEDDSQDMVVIGNGATDVDFIVEDDAGAAVLTVDSQTSKTTLHSLDVTNNVGLGDVTADNVASNSFHYNNSGSLGAEAFTIGATGGVEFTAAIALANADFSANSSDGAVLNLKTTLTNADAVNILGRINFSAPVSGSAGHDSRLLAASIVAQKNGTFSSDFNQTDLIFQTGNSETATEKMRIRHDGLVGIGTSSPAQKLHVAGNVMISNNTFFMGEDADGDDIGLLGLHSNNNCYVGPKDNAYAGGFMLYGAASNTSGHVWYSGNAEAMRIDSSQRVGIGTNSPSKKFVVKGASGDQARFEHNGAVGSVDIYSGTDGGLINVRNASGTSIIELDGRSGNLELPYGRITDAGTDMNIVSDNALTLGTESGTALTIANASTTVVTTAIKDTATGLGFTGNISLDNVTNTAAEYSALPVGYSRMMHANLGVDEGMPKDNQYFHFTKIANRDAGGGWGGIAIAYNDGADSYIGTTTTSSSFASWRKIISQDANGFVGIGSTASHKLHITSGTSNSALRIDADASRGANRYALDIQDDDGNARGVVRARSTAGTNTPIYIAEGNDHDYIFQTKNTSASDAEQFRIEHFDGNVRMNSLRGSLCINEEGGQRVGIATSSPSVKLHVNDNNVLIGNNSSGYATLFFHNEGTGSGRYGSIMKNYDSPFDMRIRASNSTSEMPLVFDGSNDTEYARFDTSGNFGIGDTTPNAKLHISHNGSAVVKAESTASGYGAYSRLTTTTNSYSLVSLNGDFLIDEDGVATRFIIKDSTGNVGINTSSPSATLEVNGTSNFTGQMYIDHGGSDYAPGINFMGGTNTPGSNAYENATIGYYDNSGTGLMRFGINRTGASNYAFYVGTTRSVIMTSTYLAVPDGAYLAAGNDNDVFIRHDGNGHFQSNSGQMYINQVASANMFFSTNNTVRACITNTGELLVSGNDTDIATVAGTGSFQVLGTGGGDTTITIGRFSNNASPPTLSFAKSRNGTIGGNTIVQDGDNLGQITFSASDGTDMVSSSAKIEVEVDGTPGANDTPGRIGFYTTADGANGSVEAMRIDSSQDAHFDQDVIAFSTTPSDIRLKKNFTKIENGLDVVNKLEGHTFNWKKGGDRLSAGFKAQEVEKILPHLVDEKKLPLKSDDDKEYKILRYEEMIPYLVEAIKEQQVQINELKTKLGE